MLAGEVDLPARRPLQSRKVGNFMRELTFLGTRAGGGDGSA